jgi:sugar phosphate isomerase/epimerase
MMTRRTFLAGAASLAAVPRRALEAPQVALWSEVCDDLGLSFEETAALVAEAGLDGIDCPVRPGAKVLPERAADDLPRVAEAQRKQGRKVLLIATAIRGPDSPHAEKILAAAAALGIRYYRIGYWKYGADPKKELEEVRARLKDLAALNRQHGLCGIFQNHSGDGCVGAKLDDLAEILRGIDPAQVAVAFDIAHALREIGDAWRERYEKLRPHAKVVYVKDVSAAGKWVRFGEGRVARTGYFELAKRDGAGAPVSMHHEHAWWGGEYPKTREGLARSVRADLATLKGWLA